MSRSTFLVHCRPRPNFSGSPAPGQLIMIAAGLILLVDFRCFGASIPPDPYVAVLNGAASIDEVYVADEAMAGKGCRSRECLAMRDIANAMTLSLHRDVPNGNVLLDPGKFDPRTFDREIDSLLGKHPERMQDYCTILIKVAQHYQGFSDCDVGAWDLDLAARVGRQIPGCLRRAVQALPSADTTQQLLAKMDDVCRNVGAWVLHSCDVMKAARIWREQTGSSSEAPQR